MRICFTVMDGFQPFSSFKMERQTFPDGYTFGWKNPAGKDTLGGFDG